MTYADYLEKLMMLYKKLMKEGYKFGEIDEMDINGFFSLLDFEHKEENKVVPAYQIFGVKVRQ
ncbi:hypothetical protein [Bacillus halotolerans]|uniref:hypothetical protein n=1 Tax=Bacillus halotolerans TaxID=260554 RepID=UPI000D04316F|nr:hypothetical protein [Bacillus halotolerans]PRS04376.1 hypothetical protein C6W26_12225 [Bacillus halotolerans]QKS03963.1 hypothetical protein HT135_06555 [Bacillus halotolerans]